MTRRLVAVAVLAMVAAAIAAGITTRVADDDAWRQQLCNAQTAMDANQQVGAAGVNGQDPQTLQQQYQAAANAYQQAAAHLQLTQLDPSTECQP